MNQILQTNNGQTVTLEDGRLKVSSCGKISYLNVEDTQKLKDMLNESL